MLHQCAHFATAVLARRFHMAIIGEQRSFWPLPFFTILKIRRILDKLISNPSALRTMA
jgi:hypothetical protein